jgi:8-oxo-dGTP diphosphatase
VETGEDLEDAARRELAEETGLAELGEACVQQLRTYGMPTRDPRARVISVVHLALVPEYALGPAQAGDDASEARFFRVRGETVLDDNGSVLPMAFDHDVAIRDLRMRLVEMACCSSAPLLLLPEHFTFERARMVYELFLDRAIDAQRFEGWIHRRNWMEAIAGTTGAKAPFRLVDRKPLWAPDQIHP